MLDAVAQIAPCSRITAAASAHDPMLSAVRTPWCVVRSNPKAERRAHASLHLRGFEAYLPLVTTRWRNRTWHTAALFPGYLFVRLDLAKPWHPVLRCPGVFCLLSIDHKPSTIANGLMRALREAVDGVEALAASEVAWKPGTPCSMAQGPFAGHVAVVLATHDDRATVAVMMFGHLREIQVGLDCLTPREDAEAA